MAKHVNRTRLGTVLAFVSGMVASVAALGDPVTGLNTFVPGQPATAASVNQNFDEIQNSVNDNDTRITSNTGDIADNFSLINDNASDITTLQSGNRPAVRTFIDIDCNADPDVLLQSPYSDNFHPYTTFNITGACNGPLYITSDGVRLVGAEPSRAASIVLPNPTSDPSNGAIFADGAHDLQIENLTVDVTQWGTWAIAQGTDAAGVYARNAFVRLIDSDIIGGLYAINPYRNAIVRMEGTINITEFVNAGISSGDHSLVTTRGQVNVSTTRTDGTTYIIGVETYRQGIVDFRGGIAVTVPAEDAGNSVFPTAITSGTQSHVNIRNAGTKTINGTLLAFAGRINANGGTITGAVDIINGSSVTFRNLVHNGGGGIRVGGNLRGGSILEVFNSTLSNATDDEIYVGPLSSMTLQDSDVGNSSGIESILIESFSMVNLFGTVDLNGRDINCKSQGSFFFSGGGINIGTVSGC